MTNEPRESAARAYEQVAEELETAARHCRTTAQHLRDGEIPRAAAHAWAAFGHARTADEALAQQAQAHAQRSTP
jgi:glycerol-3-phosphate dehydrogenase